VSFLHNGYILGSDWTILMCLWKHVSNDKPMKCSQSDLSEQRHGNDQSETDTQFWMIQRLNSKLYLGQGDSGRYKYTRTIQGLLLSTLRNFISN